MAKKTTIRVSLRKDKLLKDGTAPLQIIYQFCCEKISINTGLKLRPENWNQSEQKAIYLDKKTAKGLIPNVDFDLLPLHSEIIQFNANITKYVNTIKDIEQNLKFQGTAFKISDVAKYFKEIQTGSPGARKSDPKVYITDYIMRFIHENISIKKERTLKTYKTTANHLENFGLQNTEKPTFSNLTISMLKDFQRYLISTGMNNTSISKHFSILKSVMKIASLEDKSLKICQDYRDFVISRKDGDNEVITLDQEELDALIELDLTETTKKFYYSKNSKNKIIISKVSCKTLDKVRDLFIFACTTSLRYSDIVDLKRIHIKDYTIHKKCIKTGQTLAIPLNYISHCILEKYKDDLNPLPIMSNQKANEYLKVLGQLAGINSTIEKTREYGSERVSTTHKKYELMSMHLGRKTFVTLSLEKGVASQDVMNITGHKLFSTFKRYMNITQARKEKAMEVWGKIEKQDKLKPSIGKTNNAS